MWGATTVAAGLRGTRRLMSAITIMIDIGRVGRDASE